MSVSPACGSLRIVLLLTALGCAGTQSSTPGTTLTTEPTHESSSTQVASDQRTSEPPPTTNHEFQQSQTEESNLPFKKDNITISAKVDAVKDIILESPTELEMLCSLVISSDTMNMETMDVFWKRENKTIPKDSISRNDSKSSWCTRHTVRVRTREDLGNYTCFYKTNPEISATFHLHVPKIHIKSKKIISYVGDHVVLSCSLESSNHSPISWNWYTMNGSEQVLVNVTRMPEKYNIMQEYANSTKLKIFHLVENDSGSYWCEAVFPLAASRGDVSLNVLTYMAPLKPFLAIAAEVIFFVTIIFVYEACTKKKDVKDDDTEKEFEQTETLKTEDSNGVGNSTARQRKV